MSPQQQVAIPPWKKKACNDEVQLWNDVATEFWRTLTPAGQRRLIAVEAEFCAKMKAIFQEESRP